MHDELSARTGNGTLLSSATVSPKQIWNHYFHFMLTEQSRQIFSCDELSVMSPQQTTVATAQVWVLTMNVYRCSECKSKCWAQKDKQQTPDRTPTSRWGCWRRWRGWWGPGRRHTAARGGRRPQRSSLSAARAASFLVTGSTPGHWEALRDRWRRAAGHPGTWRSRRGQFNNPFKNSDAGMRFTLQKRPSRVPITALFLSTLSHHREFVWLIRCRRLV